MTDASAPEHLEQLLRGRGTPPVHLWNPASCGEIDIRIARDGTWYHEGRPIRRMPLVRLFASVLRRDDDGYCLVTPHEKLLIKVDDVPFIAVDMNAEGEGDSRRILFRTNVDDIVQLDAGHPLRFGPAETGGAVPYIRVRGHLDARLARAVFYRLVDLAEERVLDGAPRLGVTSAGGFFLLE